MVAVRTTDPRSVTITKTSGSTAITGASGTFAKADAGRPIAGTGIPAGATLAAVASTTAATLSANATATGSSTATIGVVGGLTAPATYGFTGWSPETETEAESYTLAAVNAGTVTPDRITDTTTSATRQRVRS